MLVIRVKCERGRCGNRPRSSKYKLKYCDALSRHALVLNSNSQQKSQTRRKNLLFGNRQFRLSSLFGLLSSLRASVHEDFYEYFASAKNESLVKLLFVRRLYSVVVIT